MSMSSWKTWAMPFVRFWLTIRSRSRITERYFQPGGNVSLLPTFLMLSKVTSFCLWLVKDCMTKTSPSGASRRKISRPFLNVYWLFRAM